MLKKIGLLSFFFVKGRNLSIRVGVHFKRVARTARFKLLYIITTIFFVNITFFQRSDPDDENKLKPGLKLELLQKDDPVNYWVVSVIDSYGLRLRLRLEGSDDEASDVWAYFLSDHIHQLGWGKKNKLRLNVPLG